MGTFLACLAAGLVLGYGGRLPEAWLKAAGKLTTGGLLLLLFAMGAKIGADPAVVSNLNTIGRQAAALALGAVAGSVLAVGMLEKNVLANRGEAER